MRGRLIAISAALILSGFIQPAHGAQSTFTVMSRNIYIGTDVTVAMKKIPNLPAAAQFMWDQVAKTDFSKEP